MADNSLIPAKPPRRRGPGRPFSKGTSGNPSGRPKLPDDLRERAQAYSLDALDALHGIVMDPDKPAAARVTAAVAIMDRGHGKPVAPVLTASTDSFVRLIEDIEKSRFPDGIDVINGVAIEHEE